MAEYIEREALRKILEEWRDAHADVDDVHGCGLLEDVICEVDAQTAADVAPVVWMPVLGFEGLYEVSSFGQVRNKNGKVLKQMIKRTNGTCYKSVDLWKDGKYYKKYIHRLLAEAFIPNPDGLPFVNHKDEDGTNNFIDNLEWCTREYNVNYGTAKERRAKKIRGVPHAEEHKKKISDGLKKYYSEHEVWNKGAKMDKGDG